MLCKDAPVKVGKQGEDENIKNYPITRKMAEKRKGRLP